MAKMVERERKKCTSRSLNPKITAVAVAPAPLEGRRGLAAHRAAAIAEGLIAGRLQAPMEQQIRVVAPVAALVGKQSEAAAAPELLPFGCT